MILKLAHVSYNSSHPDADVAAFVRQGCLLDWFERKLPNPPGKRRFLNQYNEFHDLALLTPMTGPKIEIVGHGSGIRKDAFAFTFLSTKDAVTFDMQVGDLEASRRYWMALGFSAASDSTLSLSPMLDAWAVQIDLRLAGKINQPAGARADGYYALAFLVNNAQRERTRLEKSGLSCTQIEQLRVLENDIALFFAVGDNGELVEFYSLTRI